MITTRHFFLISGILYYLIMAIQPAQSDEIKKISVLGGLGEYSERILKIRNQPFEVKDGLVIIDVTDRTKSCKNLIECAKALYFKLSVIRENIDRMYDLYDIELKGPYQRKITRIDDNGNVCVERIAKWLYVYDPANPDAIKTGNLKGYIPFPRINYEIESRDFIGVVSELKALGKILKLLEPNIVIRIPDAPPTKKTFFNVDFPPKMIDPETDR